MPAWQPLSCIQSLVHLPLPYQQDRIVAGDSLLGIRGEQAKSYIEEWGRFPLADSFERDVAQVAPPMDSAGPSVHHLTIDEIEDSKNIHDAGRSSTAIVACSILIAGLRWNSAGMKQRDRRSFHEPLNVLLRGDPRRAVAVLYRRRERSRAQADDRWVPAQSETLPSRSPSGSASCTGS